MAVNVFVFATVFLKHKAELVSSGCKKSNKSAWSFGRSGMMLHTSETGAFKRAMDMKSQLIVAVPSLLVHILIFL